MGPLLALVGVVVFIVGAIAVVYPLKRLHIQTRRHGGYVVFGGVIVIMIGAVVTPQIDRGPTEAVTTEQQAAIAEQLRVHQDFHLAPTVIKAPYARELTYCQGVLFIGTRIEGRGSTVWGVHLAGNETDAMPITSEDTKFMMPAAVSCLSSGTLLVVTRDQVLVFRDAASHFKNGNRQQVPTVIDAGFPTPINEFFLRWKRAEVDPAEQYLYTSVPPRDDLAGNPIEEFTFLKKKLPEDYGDPDRLFSRILRTRLDRLLTLGEVAWETVARGVRDAGGLTFDSSGNLWFTHNALTFEKRLRSSERPLDSVAFISGKVLSERVSEQNTPFFGFPMCALEINSKRAKDNKFVKFFGKIRVGDIFEDYDCSLARPVMPEFTLPVSSVALGIQYWKQQLLIAERGGQDGRNGFRISRYVLGSGEPEAHAVVSGFAPRMGEGAEGAGGRPADVAWVQDLSAFYFSDSAGGRIFRLNIGPGFDAMVRR